MKTVAVIQARIASTRLPGKVMKKLCGKTILEHVISRVKGAKLVDEIVVATTSSSKDDKIIEESGRCRVKCYRGSEHDVLSRYYQAAKEFNADVVIRITSDCPLLDPTVLNRMIQSFHEMRANDSKPDYLSNTLKRTYPRGLDVEIFDFQSLEKAHREASLPFEREHVTPYIYKHPELFALENFSDPADLSQHRWTVDTQEDLDLVQEIYNALYEENKIFSTESVLTLLKKNDHWTDINKHIKQKGLAQ